MNREASIFDPRGGRWLGSARPPGLQGFARPCTAYASTHLPAHPRPSHQRFRRFTPPKRSAFSAMVLRPWQLSHRLWSGP